SPPQAIDLPPPAQSQPPRQARRHPPPPPQSDPTSAVTPARPTRTAASAAMGQGSRPDRPARNTGSGDPGTRARRPGSARPRDSRGGSRVTPGVAGSSSRRTAIPDEAMSDDYDRVPPKTSRWILRFAAALLGIGIVAGLALLLVHESVRSSWRDILAQAEATDARFWGIYAGTLCGTVLVLALIAAFGRQRALRALLAGMALTTLIQLGLGVWARYFPASLAARQPAVRLVVLSASPRIAVGLDVRERLLSEQERITELQVALGTQKEAAQQAASRADAAGTKGDELARELEAARSALREAKTELQQATDRAALAEERRAAADTARTQAETQAEQLRTQAQEAQRTAEQAAARAQEQAERIAELESLLEQARKRAAALAEQAVAADRDGTGETTEDQTPGP
ncbi:MAG: hypothetical protein ACOCYV_01510, partial [Planctomycetota bacterium]